MLHAMTFLYAGPDQIMTVTSGLASLLGVLLIFWNRIVGAVFRVLGLTTKSASEPDEKNAVQPVEEPVSKNL
jgi:undecaprenyl pyrophosphate phosphatase UppP